MGLPHASSLDGLFVNGKMPSINGFVNGKMPSINGWWLGVPLWLRKPPCYLMSGAKSEQWWAQGTVWVHNFAPFCFMFSNISCHVDHWNMTSLPWLQVEQKPAEHMVILSDFRGNLQDRKGFHRDFIGICVYYILSTWGAGIDTSIGVYLPKVGNK